jgi:perosamine synthetase|tara:strand:- start:309 stop:1436 length:1128 start_codon:yes stop_codon:yes gene_type:complete
MNNFIAVNEPVLSGNEGKYVQECIDSGWISSEGPFVDRFEQEFAKKIGRKYAVAVSSGTAALDVSIAALKIGPGDEVIMPTLTIISCASAVIKAGGTPVLVDCNPNDWNMAVDQIESLITPSTVAIMAVHIYGLPVDMNPIFSLAIKYNLIIIEDAAEVIGQTYHKRSCGSLGKISIFSFYPNKHITTGEGGMVVTDDLQLANRCRSLRNLCFQQTQRFVHEELGWNYRMSNIQAAIGCAQLEKLDEHVLLKRKIGEKYSSIFKGVKGIKTPLLKTEYADNIYWVYGVVLEDALLVDAQPIMNSLKENGIGTRPFFWCMHEQPVFNKMGLFINQNFPVAEKLARKGFYFPSGLNLNDEQIERVGHTFKKILRQYY